MSKVDSARATASNESVTFVVSVPWATPTRTAMRRSVVGTERLMTCPKTSSLLGTMMVTSSRVTTCVARNPTSMTEPQAWPISTEITANDAPLDEQINPAAKF